ncbi:MAG: two-component regulator propeller domain-containing protein [Candidatus Cloacimonadaceae bacterium]
MKNILFTLVFLLVIIALCAQTTNWLNYTCGKEVYCLAAENNFIWAGTNGGLVKINRLTSEKTHFNPANSGLRGTEIKAMVIDSQGNKWIATYAGLNRFDGTNWSIHKPAGFDTYISINCLAIDAQDNIWLGGYLNGLYKYHPGNGWTHFDTINYPYVPYYVNSLAVDSQNNLWMGVYNQVVKFNGTDWIVYNNLDSYAGSYAFDVTQIACDNQVNVWLGSTNDGLLKYNGSGWTFFDINNGVIYNDYTNALYCDSANNLWLGTAFGGLIKYDGTDWTVYSDYPNAIFPWRVYDILVDAQNHIWTGTEHLYEYNGTDWTVHNTANSPLPEIRQYNVHADSQDRIWLGGNSGLTCIAGQTWTNYNNTNSGFPQESAFALDSDSNGKLWCLARDTGYDTLDVVSFDGTNWTVFNSSNSILTGDTFCLTVDNLNRVWLGSGHGTVYKYDGNAWTELTVPITVPWGNGILYIGADSQNNIYAYGYWGLARYNGTQWTVWQYDTIPVPIGNLLDFYLDPQDNVWIGSKAGLAQFNGTTWSYYDPSNSNMPYGFALAMCRDNLGNLWFRSCYEETDGCLVKFDGTTWTSFYSYDYPLTHSEINDIACDSYNNLWMATDNGITVYNETGIVANQDDVLPIVTSDIFRLKVYPNPFGAKANISFDMAKNEHVSLCIYDVKGRLVKRLHNALTQKGSNSSEWDGTDKSGKQSANGIYFCRIETSSGRQMKKLVLIK